CGFDVMLEDVTVGLDAAHIMWHQAGGPADVRNGLCLCVLHHKLFDRGVFTLDEAERVVVSERSRGRDGFREWLMAFHGRGIRRPVRDEYRAAGEFLGWHRREVFRGPGRDVA
ncbi:MAG: HNH endonuclease, partial [Phycisphaerales bacterium]